MSILDPRKVPLDEKIAWADALDVDITVIEASIARGEFSMSDNGRLVLLEEVLLQNVAAEKRTGSS